MSSSDDDIIYGLHAVQAALETNPDTVDSLWVDEQRKDKRLDAIFSAARNTRLHVQAVPRAKLDRICNGGRHQGVAARMLPVRLRRESELFELIDRAETTPLLLVLDGIQDPHNLGACIRSAAAAGVQAVIVPEDKSAPLTAVARRAAAGAAETVPIFRVKNLARVLKQLQEHNLWVVGAAGEEAQSLYDIDLAGPVVIVMGAEGAGLRRLTREHCDYLAAIPMPGIMESLNVSVATGIFLFEAVRQRRVR
ncbi:MAG: 23S rRNA (guanosine(2251)-2'-O)-methyltransferase RlmB [Gammaproteobacteria bacterium]|nr:23S rRNA (guanosine(2251)-2'-O)-methyltransferase RlmB [Gammaproteobacteria bacterium]